SASTVEGEGASDLPSAPRRSSAHRTRLPAGNRVGGVGSAGLVKLPVIDQGVLDVVIGQCNRCVCANDTTGRAEDRHTVYTGISRAERANRQSGAGRAADITTVVDVYAVPAPLIGETGSSGGDCQSRSAVGTGDGWLRFLGDDRRSARIWGVQNQLDGI